MSKDQILQTIRQNAPELYPLPEHLPVNGINQPEELKEFFKASLRMVGAECVELKDGNNLASYLETHYPEAIDFSRQEIRAEYPPSCPKEKLDQLGTVLLTGQFAVAENGAVWLDDSNFPNRLVPFIAQRLIIRLDAGQIVGNMHEAYSRLNLKNTGFGVFISGPSKTADIEQSLVYGAHGAVSLSVILTGV